MSARNDVAVGRALRLRGLGIFVRNACPDLERVKEWNDTARKYEVDTEGWRRWCESLHGSEG